MTWAKFLAEGEKAVRLVREGLIRRNRKHYPAELPAVNGVSVRLLLRALLGSFPDSFYINIKLLSNLLHTHPHF